jgi:tight adherence protein C
VYTTLVIGTWAIVLASIYVIGRRLTLRRRSRERVFASAEAEAAPVDLDDAFVVTRWLDLAGFRAPGATLVFLTATGLGLCVGLAVGYVAYALGLVQDGIKALGQFPGGLGDLLLPAVYLGPWLPAVVLGSLPAVFVRSARRRRVEQVEADLPLFLELLATLGEAGLGFDAAVQRILTAQPGQRPLAEEVRQFQTDVLAGRGRVASLRRLGRRIDVMPFTLFISALVQAEQSGAGMADVLRRQADDLRYRRREEATAVAMALPVKLLFPLFICFLPGIFVAAVGPAYYQFFQYADSIIRTRTLPSSAAPHP